MDTTKLGTAQAAALPIIMELAEAGHLIQAYKMLGFATRVDFTVIRRNRARTRYTRKLEKMMAELDRLQDQACAKLHTHQ